MRAIFLTIFLAISGLASADTLTFDFKNPSFSGQGYSNHVLAIEQLQANRKKELDEKAEADARAAEREAANTTLAKFLNNVESRIYANLSKQLVDNMFTDDGATSGTADIEGATIYWIKDTTSDTITVQITEQDGTFTEIIVPLTGFGF
jgi:Na+-transporting NADH:ubiquinone oxidoreductase subunit NqrC